MKKIFALIFSIALLVCSFGASVYAEEAEEDSYKYERVYALIADVVYQDYIKGLGRFKTLDHIGRGSIL